MIEILRDLTIFLFIIQLVSIFIYNRQFILNWISTNSNAKKRWVKKRDRFILALSIYFLIISYFISKKIAYVNGNLAYVFSVLVLAMTLTIILFHWTKFKIFQPGVRKRIKSKKNFFFREDFKLKKISESDLRTLIYISYSDSFSSDFKDFKRIFVDRDESGAKLICTETVLNKLIGYSKIFELMHDLSENGILDLCGNDRKEFLHFIKNNFQRGNTTMDLGNLNSSYTKWLGKNR